jgi:hypothetical protein
VSRRIRRRTTNQYIRSKKKNRAVTSRIIRTLYILYIDIVT